MQINLRSFLLVICFKLYVCGKNTDLSQSCVKSLEKMLKCGGVRAGQEGLKQLCSVSRCIMDSTWGCSKEELDSIGFNVKGLLTVRYNLGCPRLQRRVRCLYYGLVSCEPAELHTMNITEDQLAAIEQEYITYCS